MNAVRLLLALIVLAAWHARPATAQHSDYAREQRWANEVVPGLMVGQAVWLQAVQPQRFLALYTEAPNPKGAVLLVHGLGVHPDYGVTGALRQRLADAGYATLAVQMPILQAGAPAESYLRLFGEAGERLDAALSYLQSRGHRSIALVAHSMGARMANHYLALRHVPALSLWISLSVSNGEFEPAGLGRVPVVDIYGEQDFPVVLQGAAGRARQLARLPGSRQALVYGADHYFTGREKDLTGLILHLLERR